MNQIAPDIWIGTYAAKGGRGLYPAWLSENGKLRVGDPDPQITDASYAVFSKSWQTAWFVHERDEGMVSAWRWTGGRWEEQGAVSSGGRAPCYLARLPDRNCLVVANYGSGSLALVSLDPVRMSADRLLQVRQHRGIGQDPDRQEGPHVHCAVVSPDGRFLYAVDLGADLVWRYPIEPDVLGEPCVAWAAPSGSGPRHLVFHPDGRHALVLCELSAQIFVFAVGSQGQFTQLDCRPAAGKDVEGNLGGHLVCVGDTVALTNRGVDTIAAFRLAGDVLEPGRAVATGGRSPRHFAFCRSFAIVANEEDGVVVTVPWGPAGPTGDMICSIEVPGACFVLPQTRPSFLTPSWSIRS